VGPHLRLYEDQLVGHDLLQDAQVVPLGDDGVHVQVGHKEAHLAVAVVVVVVLVLVVVVVVRDGYAVCEGRGASQLQVPS